MFLGREFFTESRIGLVYQNGKFTFDFPSDYETTVNSIFAIDAITTRDCCNFILEGLDSDLDFETRERLLATIREIDNMVVEPIQDN